MSSIRLLVMFFHLGFSCVASAIKPALELDGLRPFTGDGIQPDRNPIDRRPILENEIENPRNLVRRRPSPKNGVSPRSAEIGRPIPASEIATLRQPAGRRSILANRIEASHKPVRRMPIAAFRVNPHRNTASRPILENELKTPRNPIRRRPITSTNRRPVGKRPSADGHIPLKPAGRTTITAKGIESRQKARRRPIWPNPINPPLNAAETGPNTVSRIEASRKPTGRRPIYTSNAIKRSDKPSMRPDSPSNAASGRPMTAAGIMPYRSHHYRTPIAAQLRQNGIRRKPTASNIDAVDSRPIPVNRIGDPRNAAVRKTIESRNVQPTLKAVGGLMPRLNRGGSAPPGSYPLFYSNVRARTWDMNPNFGPYSTFMREFRTNVPDPLNLQSVKKWIELRRKYATLQREAMRRDLHRDFLVKNQNSTPVTLEGVARKFPEASRAIDFRNRSIDIAKLPPGVLARIVEEFPDFRHVAQQQLNTNFGSNGSR